MIDGLSGYIDAYEKTYRYHYAMQDDWLSIVANPESKNFLGSVPNGKPMDFTMFEQVMLAVANEGDWTRSRPSVADHNIDGGISVNFIIDWRIKMGNYLPDVDGRKRAAVWRDNWRSVRDALVEINAKSYYLSPRRAHEGLEELTVDESVLKATMVLCKRLRLERGIEGSQLSPDSAAAYTVETHIATQLKRLADGVWKQYIVGRSGKPYQLQFMTQ